MKEQNDNLKETLSALMDNEASELELRRVLKAMEQGDHEHSSLLKGSWHRYHIVRNLLDEQSRNTPSTGFLAGIQSEISQSAPDFPSSLPGSADSRSGSVFRIAGQGLIAASVAMLALTLSFNLLQNNDSAQGLEVAAGEDGSVTGNQNLTAQNSETVNFTNELDPEAAEQLRRAVFRDIGGDRNTESLEVPVRFRLDNYQD